MRLCDNIHRYAGGKTHMKRPLIWILGLAFYPSVLWADWHQHQQQMIQDFERACGADVTAHCPGMHGGELRRCMEAAYEAKALSAACVAEIDKLNKQHPNQFWWNLLAGHHSNQLHHHDFLVHEQVPGDPAGHHTGGGNELHRQVPDTGGAIR
jgi:hypothetical protein